MEELGTDPGHLPHECEIVGKALATLALAAPQGLWKDLV